MFAFLDESQLFATTRYDPAARAWLKDGALPDEPVLQGLVQRTGMPREGWVTRLNLEPDNFRVWLIDKDVLGRYDGRISALLGPASGDLSHTGVTKGFSAAIQPYLAGLGYTATARSPYIFRAAVSWNYAHNGSAPPDVVPDLAAAMALNSNIRVLSMAGRHDLATPFQLTERDLARLEMGGCVVTRTYDGRHMSYFDRASRVLQRRDIAAFMRDEEVPAAKMMAGPAAFGNRSTRPSFPQTLIRAEDLMLDPWVPRELRESVTPSEPSTGAALKEELDRLLSRLPK